MFAGSLASRLTFQAVAAGSATARRDGGYGEYGYHQPQQLPERLRARESMAAGPADLGGPQGAESIVA